MPNIFYEDGGQFKVASIIQKNDSTYQANTQHGKRVKIKINNVFIEFDGSMDDFLQSAQAQANDIDTELLWECVGTDEFDFQAAAKEYFGSQPSKSQLAATLMALYAAPMYFHKKNKGVFKATPENVLKQALAAIERKAQQEAQVQKWAEQLVSGSLHDEIATELPKILHAPDKQSLAYKAFYQAMDKRVAIHIAAPSLAIEPNSEIEKIILQRLSTVYFPANKITMLPKNWISAFSLDEGKIVPAFSIYFDVSSDWQLSEPISKIELVPIETNLRIQHIEPFFNSETGVGSADNPQFKHHADCLYLLELSYELQKKRDRLEDPTLPKKYDYGIDFDADGKVIITRRERGSPIDTLVSEMMILANTSWAKMLHDNNLAGLFRVQPSGRVRMSTHSEPHIGMNVAHYGWFTSPLRRASDYINQKQLQSVLQNDVAPRFDNTESDLFVALGNFEAAYSAYRAFQDMMESYWAMVWLKQENIREINAVVLKEELVRLEGLPLTARATGIPMEIAPKSTVKLAINEIDPEQQFIALKYLTVIPDDVSKSSLLDE